MSQGPDTKNLIVAMMLSAAILIGWEYFVLKPQRDAAKREQLVQAGARTQLQGETAAIDVPASGETVAAAPALQSRDERLVQDLRIPIESSEIGGSIRLKGLRFDDITLKHYTLSPEDKTQVTLLSPARGADSYFTEFGWIAAGNAQKVPDASTLWQMSDGSQSLKAGAAITAFWENGQGLRFERRISMDEHYMFTIEDRVVNQSGTPVTLYPYGLISRNFADEGKHFYILHEGPLGVFNDALEEVSYADLRDDGKIEFKGKADWIGITDKYWLNALVPDQSLSVNATMQYHDKGGEGSYQVDFTGTAQQLASGQSLTLTHQMFAGAKKVALLDDYAQRQNITLFDRAVDFGWFYFLTKPIFYALSFFNQLLGNFGLAILALTVCIKLLLFPLANKSYKAMSQMKVLMPKIQELKERHKDDKMALNQAIMKMYQEEKVNPASGCLPMLIQIPIFFSLYKVLFVTIEMRQADFYGWINDLSAPDPTNIFELFGLFPWDAPSFMHIGAWPLIMCASMVIQMRLNPKPTDPAQAAVMQWMPFIFLFLFASFPAGLVIYWAWNNTLSIMQQYVIMKRHGAR